MSASPIRIMSPGDAAEWLATQDAPQFIDVRTPGEHDIASIDGARLLPMNEISSWVHDLDPERPVLVLCHHGIRSMNVAMYLSSRGFMETINLAGGIDRWSLEVDQGVPRY
jgi:rhodanese-related sulfurtransferase